jgi:dolichol kinase
MTPESARPPARAADTDAAYRLVGLAIIALVPAAFWSGLAALIGHAVGHPPSLAALATFGAAIATFLITVVSAVDANARRLS